MTILMIDAKVEAEISEAIAQARKTPITLETVKQHKMEDKAILKLEDRPLGFERPPVSVSVLIPMGFRANISFEEQPIGLCRHLSISTPNPGTVPNQVTAEVIAKAFGCDPILRVWVEEFEPGHFAVNLLAPDTTGKENIQ